MSEVLLTSSVVSKIAHEIQALNHQVLAAVELLDNGATVPFIARYRKEVTGGLDDTQLRVLEERLVYLRELEERRKTVLNAIEVQGKLTEELKAQILAIETKQELEDVYAPYKIKRRTRAMIAREAGLEPLAMLLLNERPSNPLEAAVAFVNEEKGFKTADEVLNGARDILSENLSLDITLREQLRKLMSAQADVVSKVNEGQASQAEKYRDYFDYRESFERVPSHRALALLRGQREGFLNISLQLSEQEEAQSRHPAEYVIAKHINVDENVEKDRWLLSVCRWTWRVKSRTAIETDLFEELRLRAEQTAIEVFGSNLRDLLLAPPAGHHAVIGLDPGFRTGVKLAAIDKTGRVLGHDVLMMHSGSNGLLHSKGQLLKWLENTKAPYIAIGNGTASRETLAVVNEVVKELPHMKSTCVSVNEAGASVYSASELAAKELPDMDVSYRGAVSIARRLQDPLAELVKIDPKAIGVGQYQHDVDHSKLERRLNAVVEDCVNYVGVDVNTASAELLSYVAGLTSRVASEIIKYREKNGPFASREELKEVPYLGEARFTQAAGFLRVFNGNNPLDMTGVHPEAYSVVKQILKSLQVEDIKQLLGQEKLLKGLKPADFVTDAFGVPTIVDIIKELEKPGRDPRSVFKTATFNDAIQTMEDLQVGMKLEGVVTNVAAFGAFVDIGVHDNGLVHVSQISDTFVKDPRDVVKVGDVVKVTVMEVDLARKRIGLSMKRNPSKSQDIKDKGKEDKKRNTQSLTALGAALMGLKR